MRPAPASVPPNSLSAEQSTLGAMLMESATISPIVELLAADDFYNTLNRKVFTGILTVHAAGGAVDLVTVAEWFRRHDQLDDVGGPEYLGALIEACPSSASFESYAGIVRELAQKRGAALIAVQAQKYALNGVSSEVALIELRRGLEALELRTPVKRQTSFNAQALLSMKLPDPAWVVPGLLPQGFTILAGNPKLGKSWLALNLAMAVAQGGMVLGKVKVEAGAVLYLALEDTARRLQTRMTKILSASPECPDLSQLTFDIEWPRLDQGGVAKLEKWLEDHKKTARLIILDTFQKVRGVGPTSNASAYAGDYEAVAGLKTLADRYGVAVMIVHHRKKGEGMDDLESISGSYGLTGAADGIWSLKRERGRSDAVLFVTGRDVDEQELALKWEAAIGCWAILGEAGEYRLSQERSEIVAALREAKRPLTPKELCDLGIGKNYPALKQTMWQMSKDGQLRNCDGGKYTLPANTSKPEENAPGVPPELPLSGYNAPLNTRSAIYD